MTEDQEDEKDVFELTTIPNFVIKEGTVGLSLDLENPATGEKTTEFILIAELDNTDAYDIKNDLEEPTGFTVLYTVPEVYTFRNFLLSLSSDDARKEAIRDLGFCCACGGDISEHGPCYCRADD